ncbi:MAG: Bcr/CflA family drug resistance efflux transporter [Rickettsiaceae bacterium]|jgi:DHA1 family bicyclomycin/chloramphenicol resistance-like MFS transporter|nr:Bcr/CflA family drug resistance efflux transporter [Rickettsiaceae bacterium]
MNIEKQADQIIHPAGQKEFVALMAVLMSVVAISIDAMLPALSVIGEAMGISHPNQAQYIISSIFVGTAIGQLICGPLSDALGRKKVLYGGLALYLVGSLICINSSSIEMMLFGRFVQGLGVSGPYISCMSIVRDKYSGRAMAKIMSLVMTIFIMVPVVAPALGQTIIMVASWKYIFVLYIFYALAVGAWIFMRLEETLPPEKRIPYKISNLIRSSKIIFTNRVTLSYTIALGCIFGALMGDLSSVQQIFQVQYKVGDMFVVYFGLQALAFGAASFVNSKLVERLGMRHLCFCATMIIVVASAIFLAIDMIMPLSFWLYFLYGVFLLFCFGMLFGNLNALAMEPMGEIAGIASSIIGCSSSIIGIVLGTIIGQSYDGAVTTIILGFLILGIAAIAIMFYEQRACKQELATEVVKAE